MHAKRKGVTEYKRECALADIFPCACTLVTHMEQSAARVFSCRCEILAEAPKWRPIKPHMINTMPKSCPNSLLPHRVGQTGPSTPPPEVGQATGRTKGVIQVMRSRPGERVLLQEGAGMLPSKPFHPNPPPSPYRAGTKSINPREWGIDLPWDFLRELAVCP